MKLSQCWHHFNQAHSSHDVRTHPALQCLSSLSLVTRTNLVQPSKLVAYDIIMNIVCELLANCDFFHLFVFFFFAKNSSNQSLLCKVKST